MSDIEFEETNNFRSNETHSARMNKFINFIYNKPISNFCRVALIDLFPILENAFLSTGRKNFVNLDQLVREVLPYLGYSKYLSCFPELKTKTRRNQVKKMVSNVLGKVPHEFKFCQLDDFEYLTPTVGNIDTSKAIVDHLFSDLNNINEKDPA